MELVVTRDLSIRALCFGACEAPRVGTPITDLPQCDLIWALDEQLLDQSELKALSIPLWAWSLSGSGGAFNDNSDFCDSDDGYGSYGYGGDEGNGYGSYGYGGDEGNGYGSYGYASDEGNGYGSYGYGGDEGNGYGGLDLGEL